ncbi:MAG: TetR/AcrR family transcriptional regulator [Pseudomonadota bacterium]
MLSPADTNPQISETKRLIREQAETLFGHYGFSKTSVGDIAKACSMSTGNIYRFFRSKQAIGIAVVHNYFEHQAQRMLEARAETVGNAADRLRATITAGVAYLVDTMDGNPRIFELAEFVIEDSEGGQLMEAQRQFLRWIVSDLVAEGAREGIFVSTDPDHDGWTLLLSTTGFWMPQALVAWHDQSMIMDDLREVLSLSLNGLRAPGRGG